MSSRKSSKTSSSTSSTSPTSSSSRVKTSNSNTDASKSSTSSLKKASKKPSSKASTKSTDSQASVASMGIAPARVVSVDNQLRFRLMPEGPGTNALNIYDHYVFDCLVFVISCDKHKTVALTNTNQYRKFSWFPFIPLQDIFTWSRMSRDGLIIILGAKDTTTNANEEGDGDTEMEHPLPLLPEHTLSWHDNFRVQVAKSKKFFMRITQHIKLTGSDGKGVKCCENVAGSRIRWVKIADILSGHEASANLWGNEVVTICRSLVKPSQSGKSDFLAEFSLKDCYPWMKHSDEDKLLKQLNWSVTQVQEVFGDYLDHLYPAFQMTLCSFRCFVLKNSLVSSNDLRISRLFRTIACGKDYISFDQLLIGIAAMDPNASNGSATRAKFIFRYYDFENKGILAQPQLCEMLADLLPNKSTSERKSQAAAVLKSLGLEAIDLQHFIEIFRCKDSKHFPYADHLLRWDKTYFEHSNKSVAAKESSVKKQSSTKSSQSATSRASTGSKTSQLSSGSKSKKSLKDEHMRCSFHKVKSYHYGRHAITLDSTCRCVDPRIISENWVKQWSSNEMSRDRYSVENVFRVNSVANIFYALIRDFKKTLLNDADAQGLIITEEDWETLYQYLELLCGQVIAILRYEPKVIRLAGPTFVIGSLQGSLLDLFFYENRLFRSAPAIAHTLLFLGNFTGSSFGGSGGNVSYGIECVIYLFALKILMPNKMYLIRGAHELRSHNGHLKQEFITKCGANFGPKIYDLVNGVFDYLPVAAVIEESILCTSSGIPQLAPGKELLTTMEKELSSGKLAALREPDKTMPICYEMIVNIPHTYANKEETLEAKPMFNPGFVKTKNGKCYFNREAFDAFLEKNKFDLMIRSEHTCQDGYSLSFGSRCLSINSARKSAQLEMATPTTTAVAQLDHSKGKIRCFTFAHGNQK